MKDALDLIKNKLSSSDDKDTDHNSPTVTLTLLPNRNMDINIVDGHKIRQVDIQRVMPAVYKELHAQSCKHSRGQKNG